MVLLLMTLILSSSTAAGACVESEPRTVDESPCGFHAGESDELADALAFELNSFLIIVYEARNSSNVRYLSPSLPKRLNIPFAASLASSASSPSTVNALTASPQWMHPSLLWSNASNS